jgi:hypothetical protein
MVFQVVGRWEYAQKVHEQSLHILFGMSESAGHGAQPSTARHPTVGWKRRVEVTTPPSDPEIEVVPESPPKRSTTHALDLSKIKFEEEFFELNTMPTDGDFEFSWLSGPTTMFDSFPDPDVPDGFWDFGIDEFLR